MKKSRVIILISSIVVIALGLTIAIPFTILGIKTTNLKSDYSYLKNDDSYKTKIDIDGIDLVTQHVSCGYASIEMMSSYYGHKVTEDDLDAKNSSISTSSSSGFLNEINMSIPDKSFVMRQYLKYDSMLKEIYESLNKNNPVVLEWAAEFEDEWTLHFSVIGGLDFQNNSVKIYNPYGYIENITIDEFLDRSSFNSYKNMPLFLNFGFAFGAFHKNTIFYAK